MIVELGNVSIETKGSAPGDVSEPVVGSKIESLAVVFL